MGIRSIFFVILAVCPPVSQPNRTKIKETNGKTLRQNHREFACLVTGESWEETEDDRSLKSRREELGKRPPLGLNLA
jgi:hypothetical protein